MRLLRFVLALSAAVFLLVPVAAQTLDADLQRAIQKEMTTGDSKAAIAEYQKIVERAGSNRPVAAQALLRMAEAYRKLGDAQERKTYERIVTDFGDQRDVAAQARARLGALTPSSATVTDRTIFRREGDLTFATVSPDGTSMTFLDESSLPTSAALLQLQTGRVTRLMSDPNTANRILFPVVSPDGMQTVFTSAGPPIELKIISNMPGAQSRTLRAADAENRYFQPRAWSSDGRSVLTEFQRKDETWQLAWIAVADGRFQVLRSVDWRRHEGLFGRPTLSSDGRYIAYSALATNPSKPVPTRADSKDTHIYVLASDGSSEVDLTPTSSATNQQPVWTADGSHVLFLSDRSGAVDLWAIGVAGGKRAGEPVLVKQNVGDVRAIGMSTAGNYYYLSIERGVPLISFAVLGARAAIDVGREANSELLGTSPSWSPDGRYLAFLRPKPGGGNDKELVVKALDSGEERRFSPEDDTKLADSRPLWLHDGRTVLQAVVKTALPQGTRPSKALYRADLKTAAFSELTAFGRFFIQGAFSAAVSNDDKTIYVRGPMSRDETETLGSNNRIVACELATGRQRDVLTAPPSKIFADLALSPNGQTLAFFTLELESNGSFAMGAPRMRVARVEVDGTGFREIVGPFILTGGGLRWGRDGRTILFAPPTSAAGPISPPGPILRLDVETGASEPTGLEQKTLQAFDLSPDGARMALSRSAARVTEVRALENLPAVLKSRR